MVFRQRTCAEAEVWKVPGTEGRQVAETEGGREEQGVRVEVSGKSLDSLKQ